MAKKTVSRPNIATGPTQTYAPRVFFVTDNFVNVIVKKIKQHEWSKILFSPACAVKIFKRPFRVDCTTTSSTIEYHLSSQTILHNTTSNKGKKSTNKP